MAVTSPPSEPSSAQFFASPPKSIISSGVTPSVSHRSAALLFSGLYVSDSITESWFLDMSIAEASSVNVFMFFSAMASRTFILDILMGGTSVMSQQSCEFILTFRDP